MHPLLPIATLKDSVCVLAARVVRVQLREEDGLLQIHLEFIYWYIVYFDHLFLNFLK